MNGTSGLTYAAVGVNYDDMDPFKRACQLAGRATAQNIRRLADGAFSEVESSRGESAYLIEAPQFYLAHVEEGLGTKNLVADAMYALTGKSYYNQIAQDAVAMIVNDMVTMGALPLSVAMHLAVGDSDWFKDEARATDLVEGWKYACNLAGCIWGGGETPTLRGVVMPGTVVLSGSATGMVAPKERLIQTDHIESGDAIVLIGSAGIHANGLTLARKIAEQLPDGYLTTLDDERTYGDALLDPTYIYTSLVEDCFDRGVDVHYLVHVTGHGWRKLMRAPQPFHYVVQTLPEVQPVFRLIQEQGEVTSEEMYGNFNMGAGFALFVPQREVETVKELAWQQGLQAINAGYIQEAADKRVILEPLGIEYAGETLAVR